MWQTYHLMNRVFSVAFSVCLYPYINILCCNTIALHSIFIHIAVEYLAFMISAHWTCTIAIATQWMCPQQIAIFKLYTHSHDCDEAWELHHNQQLWQQSHVYIILMWTQHSMCIPLRRAHGLQLNAHAWQSPKIHRIVYSVYTRLKSSFCLYKNSVFFYTSDAEIIEIYCEGKAKNNLISYIHLCFCAMVWCATKRQRAERDYWFFISKPQFMLH